MFLHVNCSRIFPKWRKCCIIALIIFGCNGKHKSNQLIFYFFHTFLLLLFKFIFLTIHKTPYSCMKLHLGCGKLKLDNFINIDVTSDCADLKFDFTNLSIFNDSVVEEIYICHALEHFKRRDIVNLLLEWNRVLQTGGLLRIAVPDFEKVAQQYLKNKDICELIGFLSGGQRDDYDVHYVNFDIYILEKLLKACGFDNVERYNPFEFLGDKDDYSKCHLPHMDFENGELMSLNVICKKQKNIDIKNLILCETLKKFTKFS